MSEREVLRAAADVVAAFGAHDTASYFGGFAPEATFIFHNHDSVLSSRSDYETLWASWESEGFHVRGCQSTEQAVTMASETVAIFTHTVRTQLADGDDTVTSGERETIVFVLRDGRWLGVHEHLSLDPTISA